MTDLIAKADDWLGLTAHPYGLGGVVLIVLYVLQSELRFGAKARSGKAGETDQGSTWIVTLGVLAPIFGFVFAMKQPAVIAGRPWGPMNWLFGPTLPGLPAIAWIGATIGLAGILLRLWAVLTLRHRYTRTLLIDDAGHTIERGGPYAFVRHPGYLGSLLCLNGVAVTSGSAPVVAVSLISTIAAYTFRIRAEDAMLVAALGEPYAAYRREVGALLPIRPRAAKRPA